MRLPRGAPARSAGGVAFGVVIPSLSLSARSAELTEKYTVASLLAQSKMDAVLLEPIAAGGWREVLLDTLAAERRLPKRTQGSGASE